MLFNSYTFWIFFSLVFVLNWSLPHRARNLFLLLASYFFYAYWDWRFLGLIFYASILDYNVGRVMARSDRPNVRKGMLIVSIVSNLGVLATFKYLGFFVTQAQELLTLIGFHATLPVLQIILPVGLSFYTFQSMSYVIDLYRRETVPSRCFQDYALYLAFFPPLIAGPIVRSGTLLPQIENRRCMDLRTFEEGLYLVLTGLFCKVVVADNMSMISNALFNQPATALSGPDVMVATYSFAFQIYGDFAGYSAIALGTARWLGFQLIANFRQPYLAQNPQDFWKRWHISLSTWLRDYLYIPLGGNRGGERRTHLNLMITMLLGGLWHGANWTFVVWGALHGVLLIGHRRWVSSHGSDRMETPSVWKRWIKRLALFQFICLTWIFFRADSVTQAGEMLARLFSGGGPSSISLFGIGLLFFLILPLFCYECWLDKGRSPYRLLEQAWPVQSLVYLYIIGMLLFFSAPVSNEFIYFQF